MIQSCPICRSKKIEHFICVRCKADLSLVDTLLQEEHNFLQQCKSALLNEDYTKAQLLVAKLCQIRSKRFYTLLKRFIDHLVDHDGITGSLNLHSGLCAEFYAPSPYHLANSLRGTVIILGYNAET
ncbi:hypothetical protein [Cysteiniphilum sp. 6C5]|uniref:hypothetical protein n=1 Tax=unclassified Cysteiniphilum TaxID=2610889 RepID=UPI003F87F578